MNKTKDEPGLTEIQREEIKAIVNSALLGFKASLRNELGLLEELLNNPNVQENLRKERLKNQAPHSVSEDGDSENRGKEVVKPKGNIVKKEGEDSKRTKPTRAVQGKKPAVPKKEEKKVPGKSRATNVRAQYRTEGGRQNEESDESNNKPVRNMSEEDDADNLEVESESSKEEKPVEKKEVPKKLVKKDVKKAYASTGKRTTGKPVKNVPAKEEESAEEEEDNNEEEEDGPVKAKPHKEPPARVKTTKQPKPQEEPKRTKKTKKANYSNQDDD